LAIRCNFCKVKVNATEGGLCKCCVVHHPCWGE
jgi:hypothetical protein